MFSELQEPPFQTVCKEQNSMDPRLQAHIYSLDKPRTKLVGLNHRHAAIVTIRVERFGTAFSARYYRTTVHKGKAAPTCRASMGSQLSLPAKKLQCGRLALTKVYVNIFDMRSQLHLKGRGKGRALPSCRLLSRPPSRKANYRQEGTMSRS